MSGNPFLFDILKCIESSTKRTRFSFIVRVVYKGGFCSFAHLRDSLKRCGFSWTVPRLFVILNFHIPGYLWRLLHYFRHSIITKLGLKALFVKFRFVWSLRLKWLADVVFIYLSTLRRLVLAFLVCNLSAILRWNFFYDNPLTTELSILLLCKKLQLLFVSCLFFFFFEYLLKLQHLIWLNFSYGSFFL